MAIVRLDPLRELLSMQERMSRMFEDTIRQRSGEDESATGTWIPPVDIWETRDELLVKAELPEVDKDQIDIRLENGVLTIRGNRLLDEQLKKQNCYRLESQYGPFSRSFSLPRTVDAERIEASYKDGVLNIRIPKHEENKPRQIQIT